MVRPTAQPIDPISSAESIITLLERLNAGKLPHEERQAVVLVQSQAIEEWMAGCPLPFAGDQSSFRFHEES